MKSRDEILSQLRRQFVPSVVLPDVLSQSWTVYEDPLATFAEMAVFSGATFSSVKDVAEVVYLLSTQAEFCSAGRVLSFVDGIHGNVDLLSVAQPHDLENLDFVICRGDFAVSENGAIWLTDQAVQHRVCFFITQFLVLIVRAQDIVHNMHQAYQRIAHPMASFGMFLAGPSKTADIEQSLVIGAHGCRQLQVFVLT